MQVKEVMTRDVKCIKPDTTLQEAAEMMKAMNIGTLPVCDNDHPVGMLTDRDITVRATAEGWDPTTTEAYDAMTPEVFFCYEDQSVEEASELMDINQVRRLVVLNQDKRLVGIVSVGDLAAEPRASKRMRGDLAAV